MHLHLLSPLVLQGEARAGRGNCPGLRGHARGVMLGFDGYLPTAFFPPPASSPSPAPRKKNSSKRRIGQQHTSRWAGRGRSRRGGGRKPGGGLGRGGRRWWLMVSKRPGGEPALTPVYGRGVWCVVRGRKWRSVEGPAQHDGADIASVYDVWPAWAHARRALTPTHKAHAHTLTGERAVRGAPQSEYEGNAPHRLPSASKPLPYPTLPTGRPARPWRPLALAAYPRALKVDVLRPS